EPGLEATDFESFLRRLELPTRSVDARVVAHPWDLVAWNAAAIEEDLGLERGAMLGEVHPLAAVLEPERVRVEPGARVEALAVLDAREGPIRIAAGAVV